MVLGRRQARSCRSAPAGCRSGGRGDPGRYRLGVRLQLPGCRPPVLAAHTRPQSRPQARLSSDQPHLLAKEGNFPVTISGPYRDAQAPPSGWSAFLPGGRGRCAAGFPLQGAGYQNSPVVRQSAAVAQLPERAARACYERVTLLPLCGVLHFDQALGFPWALFGRVGRRGPACRGRRRSRVEQGCWAGAGRRRCAGPARPALA